MGSHGMGKRKGAAFERRICVALSRFIDPDGNDTIFWRSAMSGGRATIQNRKGIANKTQLGDITCVHKAGLWITDNFFIECKFYGDLDLESSILIGRGKLAKFWRKAVKEAKNCKRHPLLIAKQNRTPTLVLTTQEGLKCFNTFTHTDDIVPRVCFWRSVTSQPVQIMFFEDMFK